MHTIPQCPACGCGRLEIVAQLDALRRERFLAFSTAKYGGLLHEWLDRIPPEVARCAECGHCWYRHQPEDRELMAMYEAGRPLRSGATPSRDPTPAMVSEMQRLYRLSADGDEPMSLLDYGSGFGRWARAGAGAGFRVTAFEPSASRGAEVGVPFELVHDLDRLQGRRFDAIQFEQVLEHVPDPLRTLQTIKAFCSEKTVVRITVPNLLRAPEGRDIWATWPFDGHSPHLLAPFEHLHGFTPRSLRSLLRRAGFRSIASHRLLRHCPALSLRRAAGRFVARLDSTSVFAEPDPGADGKRDA